MGVKQDIRRKFLNGVNLVNLPPRIYLISLLRSHAEAIQLDPKRLGDGYIKNISY